MFNLQNPTELSICSLEPNRDMYGVGLCAAFYLSWFSIVIIQFNNEHRLPLIRIFGFLLSSTTFIALIIETASSRISAAEISVVLLLIMGRYILQIPHFVWQSLVCCDISYDTENRSQERRYRGAIVLDFALLIAISSYAVWFWCASVSHHLTMTSCRQIVFFFSPVNISDAVIVGLNAAIYILILVYCCSIFVLVISQGYEERREGHRRSRHRNHINTFVVRDIRTISDLVSAAAIIFGAELTLIWNNITTNDVRSATQLVPLIVVIGILIKTLVSCWVENEIPSRRYTSRSKETHLTDSSTPERPRHRRNRESRAGAPEPGSQDFITDPEIVVTESV